MGTNKIFFQLHSVLYYNIPICLDILVSVYPAGCWIQYPTGFRIYEKHQGYPVRPYLTRMPLCASE